MANAPTLYDFELSLNDPERGLSQTMRVKTARHPSETLERVWLRLLAYCWKWEERLEFGPGLSDTDAPDLVATDLTGQLTQWIRVGKGEPGKIQRALDRNPTAKVSVLFESPFRLAQFQSAAAAEGLTRLAKADLAALEPTLLGALAQVDERRTKVTVTLVSDHFYLDRDGETLEGELLRSAVAAGG